MYISMYACVVCWSEIDRESVPESESSERVKTLGGVQGREEQVNVINLATKNVLRTSTLPALGVHV
jgi:hypothetical protein